MDDVAAAKSQWREWILAIAIALVVVILLRWYVVSPTVVSGESMEPNFYHNDRVMVNKMIYKLREPKRGEVIVFHASEQKDYIKRVIALPGDRIMVKGDDVYINGQIVWEPYIAESVRQAHEQGTLYNQLRNFKITNEGIVPVVVPDQMLFVMGDNRPSSNDSRNQEIGFIPIDQVVGRADLIFWPLRHFEVIQHSEPEVKS
ncbi:signal peptidase I [Marinicrinis lubricantis]|uniref:Signal peptidase I n=1 Tax=Marinicrinis lubricantis TaxID=2086470 RepID=A0ABW1IMJ5_9BACL